MRKLKKEIMLTIKNKICHMKIEKEKNDIWENITTKEKIC